MALRLNPSLNHEEVILAIMAGYLSLPSMLWLQAQEAMLSFYVGLGILTQALKLTQLSPTEPIHSKADLAIPSRRMVLDLSNLLSCNEQCDLS